jgi:hypothetical protein
MGDALMAKPLTKHQQMLVQWGTRDWARRMEEIGAEHPVASLSQKMYRQASIREPDATRGFCSPLGGQAVAAQQTKGED